MEAYLRLDPRLEVRHADVVLPAVVLDVDGGARRLSLARRRRSQHRAQHFAGDAGPALRQAVVHLRFQGRQLIPGVALGGGEAGEVRRGRGKGKERREKEGEGEREEDEKGKGGGREGKGRRERGKQRRNRRERKAREKGKVKNEKEGKGRREREGGGANVLRGR